MESILHYNKLVGSILINAKIYLPFSFYDICKVCFVCKHKQGHPTRRTQHGPYVHLGYWTLSVILSQISNFQKLERDVPKVPKQAEAKGDGIMNPQKFLTHRNYDDAVLVPKWLFLAHLSRRLEWAIVIAHRPSSVRPSSVRPSSSVVVRRPVVVVRKLSHFRLLLQNRLMDFDETWYAWSTHGPLQVLLFFGQIRPGADPGRGKNRSRGVPFFKKLLLQTGRLQRQTECIAMS